MLMLKNPYLCFHSNSALMSFVSSKSQHNLNPNVTAEITELLALVSQMEKCALDVQAMQCALENRMNQAQHFVDPVEVKTEMAGHYKEPNNSGKEHELSSAFEMLHTQDKTNDIGDFTVKCKTIEKVETRHDLMDTVLPAVLSHHSETLDTTKTVIAEVEHLWSRIVSLADKIGIDRHKILLVKDI